jgi:hypothetical protein
MKKVILSLLLSVFAVSLSLASATVLSSGNQLSITEYEVVNDGCDKDCKKACCAKKDTTTKSKKTCTKEKSCCKSGEAKSSCDKDAKVEKKSCCSKDKKASSKTEEKAAN